MEEEFLCYGCFRRNVSICGMIQNPGKSSPDFKILIWIKKLLKNSFVLWILLWRNFTIPGSWINLQSLEDTQVGYISQKYTLDMYTLRKYTLGKYTFEKIYFGKIHFGKNALWEKLRKVEKKLRNVDKKLRKGEKNLRKIEKNWEKVDKKLRKVEKKLKKSW